MMGNTQWGLGIHMIIFISIISLSLSTVKCLGARNLTATCSNQERLALLKFKHSVKDEFGMLSSWNGGDCCKWKRVHCNGATGNVVSLHLRGNVELSYRELEGEDYESVVDILVGEDYYVTGDSEFSEEYQLVGDKVNPCLAELRHLKYLELSGNDFRGSRIPEFIGSFKKLSYLNLSNAGFIGNIPHHIGNLSNLKVLDLSTTEPVMVDDMAWFSGLSSLEHLSLNGVDLSGAQNLDRLLYTFPSLLKLSLSYCSLSNAHLGFHLNSNTKLSNIRHLDLSGNNIESQLPVFLQNMTSLAFLDLSGSNLSLLWNSANLLTMFPSLSELRLSRCELQTINISPTHLNFSTCSNLQQLDLSDNRIEGRFPDVLTNMSSLLSLDLSRNNLNSSVPAMPNLLKLDLSFNMIKHVGIRRQCHLKQLIVSFNRLEKEMVGPSINVSECPQYAFERLHLSRNDLSGNFLNSSISEILERLTNLRDLDLSHNELTGSIPHCFGNFYGMTELPWHTTAAFKSWYDGNVMQVIKGVTLEYSKMWGLVINMVLSSNKLIGEIPRELTALSGLLGLNLSHNHLIGHIPKCIGNMTSLFSLDFSSNELIGTIPPSIASLNFLSHLNLSHNNLSGRIPTGNQLQTLTDPSIYAANKDLCGAPLPKNCFNHEDTTTDTSKNKHEDANEHKKVWFYLITVRGFATGFWGFVEVFCSRSNGDKSFSCLLRQPWTKYMLQSR
ncbi:leucine-rich repeat protein [Artemisia annua]|uniref:Leucine-rich repeat protein n=1 Tax=Artemisia annua TaxID=35608 RepID=A0A2U1LJ47_ARTAN|nr:leucine-rich repeat protein [Artemisia annua]